MRTIIERIATGPELSKDISREEARAGMRLVLEGKAEPVQAAIFLIALRMKRETDDEMCGILDAARQATVHAAAPVDELLDIGDPYDGYLRSLPVAPFLPAVLAASGVPSLSHGVESIGPKYGVTHRQVLRAAGIDVDATTQQAAARLSDPTIGWAYVDQNAFCPALYALAPLRKLIVKRTALTTIEPLLGPIRARHKTHLVTGYVHKTYPRIYALLARAAGFESALLVRGVEGGVVPSLRQEGRFLHSHNHGDEQPGRMAPAEFGFGAPLQPPPIPAALQPAAGARGTGSIDAGAVAAAAAEAGLRALEGEPGPARENIIAAAALCLRHLRRQPTLRAGADSVRVVLDSGRARNRFFA